MAPVPILYHPEPASCTSPHLLQNVWCRLYPEGADPEYRVYREHLARALYEYYAEVTLHHSFPSGASLVRLRVVLLLHHLRQFSLLLSRLL